MSIKWDRSFSGYVESKCGKYLISPVRWGGGTSYSLNYRPQPGTLLELRFMCETQKEAKESAEEHNYSKCVGG
jgi:hypothetical protein